MRRRSVSSWSAARTIGGCAAIVGRGSSIVLLYGGGVVGGVRNEQGLKLLHRVVVGGRLGAERVLLGHRLRGAGVERLSTICGWARELVNLEKVEGILCGISLGNFKTLLDLGSKSEWL